MSHFVEMHLYSIARLCRSMPAFGAARRLVGEKSHALEFITGKLVCHGLQCASVICCSNAIRTVCATVEKGAEVHSSKRSILFHTCLNPHFDGVASPMYQKDLFTSTGDFDRPAGTTRQFSSAYFVWKGIAFATESSTNMRSNYAHMRLWQPHHFA